MNYEINKFLDLINSTLAPLISKSSSVALFDFPDHSNVGDSAIWLGEVFYLINKLKIKIIAVDNSSLIHRPLPKLPADSVILIQGGGNFGDLYPRHQALREALITHYVDRRVIQLPQSIYFQDQAKKAECRKIFNSHRDFHLLVRDHVSLAQAQELHDGPSYLCPDMALCLGPRQRPVAPRYDIVCLLRTDKEKATENVSESQKSASVLTVDWPEKPESRLEKIVDRIDTLHANYPRWTKTLFRLKHPFYHRLAKERMLRGETLLSSGKVVVTDRLHGHIMCTLLDLPHVVLDNSYRKIRNFRDAWGTGGNKCLAASTLGDAMHKARELLNS